MKLAIRRNPHLTLGVYGALVLLLVLLAQWGQMTAFKLKTSQLNLTSGSRLAYTYERNFDLAFIDALDRGVVDIYHPSVDRQGIRKRDEETLEYRRANLYEESIEPTLEKLYLTSTLWCFACGLLIFISSVPFVRDARVLGAKKVFLHLCPHAVFAIALVAGSVLIFKMDTVSEAERSVRAVFHTKLAESVGKIIERDPTYQMLIDGFTLNKATIGQYKVRAQKEYDGMKDRRKQQVSDPFILYKFVFRFMLFWGALGVAGASMVWSFRRLQKDALTRSVPLGA